MDAFDFDAVVPCGVMDVSRAHLWDNTAVSALDKVVFKCRHEGAQVEVLGLNQASATLVDKLAVHEKMANTGSWGIEPPVGSVLAPVAWVPMSRIQLCAKPPTRAKLACTPQGLVVIDRVEGLGMDELSALIGLPLKAA